MPDSLLFDHIAIGASSLEQGTGDLKRRLKIEIPFGGTHPRMATHNCLTRLGGDSFLEIISIDPDAPAPDRPRWFDLDDPSQRRLLTQGPRPIAWIARTRSIALVLSRARDQGLDLGQAIEMTRGDLRWLIAIRDDGQLPEGGTLPVIIQWPDGPLPATRMTDLGLRLKTLRLHHPSPHTLRAKLEAFGAAHLATIQPAETGKPSVECDVMTSDGGTCSL